MTGFLPIKPALGASLAICCLLLSSISVKADDAFDNWYQVDVIVFKPSSANPDEEDWATHSQTVPADIIAISGPDFFKLSQLEQASAMNAASDQQNNPLQDNSASTAPQFAFSSDNNLEKNRRIIEAATGQNESAGSGRTNSDDGAQDRSENQLDSAAQGQENTDNTDNNNSDLDLQTQIKQLVEMTNPQSPGALAFSRRDQQSTLKAIIRSLNRSSRFEVLGHYAWVQPINAETTAVLIQAGERFDDSFEVEGTLGLYRSRFLHAETDLWLTRFAPKTDTPNPYLMGFESSLEDEVLAGYPQLVDVERNRGLHYPESRYPMKQSRRMRSDELHYIDHPMFGLVIRITRYSPEEDS